MTKDNNRSSGYGPLFPEANIRNKGNLETVIYAASDLLESGYKYLYGSLQMYTTNDYKQRCDKEFCTTFENCIKTLGVDLKRLDVELNEHTRHARENESIDKDELESLVVDIEIYNRFESWIDEYHLVVAPQIAIIVSYTEQFENHLVTSEGDTRGK